MLELSLKEFCDKTGVNISKEEIAILETYIELKIKDRECSMVKPYMTNIRGDKLYPNRLEPFKVTCDSTEHSGLFRNNTDAKGRVLFYNSESSGLFD